MSLITSTALIPIGFHGVSDVIAGCLLGSLLLTATLVCADVWAEAAASGVESGCRRRRTGARPGLGAGDSSDRSAARHGRLPLPTLGASVSHCRRRPQGRLVGCGRAGSGYISRTGLRWAPFRGHRATAAGRRPVGTPSAQWDPVAGQTAFVLGGGGLLGAAEVGMLQALTDRAVRPELVLGSSVGAINGAAFAADPSAETVARLAELWSELGTADVFASSLFGQLRTLARSRTHLHSNDRLRALVDRHAAGRSIEDLAVPFQCVAASIERGRGHWFDRGPLTDAVLASCAVPGLLPPVLIDGEHYLDGGLVDSLPLGRAVALGATTIFVLHVGRIERPLQMPRWPWEVALVAFEVARRHRFVEDVHNLPASVRVHVLPTGDEGTPLATLRYRDSGSVATRIARARTATADYLAGALPAPAAAAPDRAQDAAAAVDAR